jgi:PAS domain S-box-containing protein/putative nucleotidyltransferase with HDIG domain
LKVNKETFQAMCEASCDSIMLLDEHGFLDCNPATLKMFTCSTTEEFIGRHPGEYSPPTQADGRDSQEAANEKISVAYKTGSNLFQWTHQKANGDLFPAEVQLTLLKLKEGDILQATVEDITDRKQAEKALAVSEEKYRNLLEMSNVGIIVHWEGKILYANSYAAEKIGCSDVDDLIGREITEFIHPEDLPACMQRIENMLVNGADYSKVEERYITKGGQTINVEVSAKPIDYEEGPALLAVIHDVTERKQAEEALRNAELYATGVIESARDAFIGIDDRGIIINWNPEAVRMFGFTAKEVIGKDISTIIIPPEYRQAHQAGLNHYLATGASTVLNKQVEITALHKKGHLLPVELSIVPLQHGDGTTFNAFIRNLSDQNSAKNALLKSADTLRESLIGTIVAISKTVEARDPYTAGHQRRVSRLARTIAQELGLDREQIEGIRMGATIHDIGKIQVPAEILSKPSLLSDIEYEIIKGHAQAGYDILKDVKFPWPIADIAHQHHERLDGSGYPQGLKGDQICLEARIVAVADTVEAMSTHRPYRPSLGIEAALGAIKAARGTGYDPDAVDVCLKLFKEKKFDFDEIRIKGV